MNKPKFTYHNKSHYRDCKSKKRFKSYEDAAKVAKIRGQRVYYCGVCEGYHITKREKYNEY